MKPISVDEFFNLTYLSNVTFSPEGRSACLTVSRIDRKKDEYRSCLYLRRNGKLRKLTSFGRESRFLYPLPARPNRLLPAAAVILIPADIFLFGPGICYP